jgi:phage baseplate assembly protein W
MAYKNLVITPNNISNQASVQQSQFYKGFSTVSDMSLTNKIYDFDLIQQDIMNMFQTKKGERVMNPEFGTVIWSLIYEPFTSDIKQLISEDVTRILNYDPRVTPTQIDITDVDYGLIIECTLFYKQQNVSKDMSLSFNKELGIVQQQ